MKRKSTECGNNKHFRKKLEEQEKNDRIDRANTQRIFLLDYIFVESDNVAKFLVRGNSGTDYDVVIDDDNDIECSCPDFQRRKKFCKHCYFLVLKVLQTKQDSENLWALAVEKISKNQINSYQPDDYKKEKETSSEKVARKEYKDRDCPICFEALEEGTLLYCDYVCGNPVHQICFWQWKSSKKTATCVYCRGKMSV